MDNSNEILKSVLASVIIGGLIATSSNAVANKGDQEKCYGIVKAGKNDCGTAKSACSATVKKDGDPSAYIYLPKGLCEKIVGGKLEAQSSN